MFGSLGVHLLYANTYQMMSYQVCKIIIRVLSKHVVAGALAGTHLGEFTAVLGASWGYLGPSQEGVQMKSLVVGVRSGW